MRSYLTTIADRTCLFVFYPFLQSFKKVLRKLQDRLNAEHQMFNIKLAALQYACCTTARQSMSIANRMHVTKRLSGKGIV